MWTENYIFQEDLQNIIDDINIPWEKLNGKNILVTGATGLIGMNIIYALLHYAKNKNTVLTIWALVRNIEKAEKAFIPDQNLHFLVADVCEEYSYPDNIDYIIHCASQTASLSFVNRPVETLNTAITGTWRMLCLANQRKIKSMVYISSMEVYGTPEKGHEVKETEVGSFDPAITRNSYPIGKIAAESLCFAFCKEYGVPVSSIRLTQTFGPGVSWDDKRVFAEFMRCALEDKDIVLKTKGETERCYLYTADAVRGILTVLLKGESGEAYTIANESTYCSIAEMAETALKTLGKNRSSLCFDLDDTHEYGYAGTLYMKLNTEKIRSLGWKPKVNLADMYSRMAEVACSEKDK